MVSCENIAARLVFFIFQGMVSNDEIIRMEMKMTEKQVSRKEINRGRTFLWLPILDCYVLAEFLIPFSVLVFTFTLLFLIGDMFNNLGDFLEHRAPASLAFRYFAMKMPGNIRFVLPISVLLSCMYSIANLGRTREITAMRASGLSLLRCGGSIYFAALCVTFVNFWFNEQLVPECDRKAGILLQSVKDKNYKANMYTMIQYRSADKSRDWLFKNFNEGNIQHDLIIKQFRTDSSGKRFLAWDLSAETAEYTGKEWVFKNVVKTPYSELIHFPGVAENFKELRFSSSEIPETPENIKIAVQPPEDLSSREILSILRSNKQMASTLRNVYSTILYYRLAFPWVCFLCVFLGLPLAAKNERAGIFLSIVSAVGAIVVFQMLTAVFQILGKQGYVPPIVGGFGPTFVFLLYSYFGVIRKLN